MEDTERELLDEGVGVKVHRPIHFRVAVDLLAIECDGLHPVCLPCMHATPPWVTDCMDVSRPGLRASS